MIARESLTEKPDYILNKNAAASDQDTLLDAAIKEFELAEYISMLIDAVCELEGKDCYYYLVDKLWWPEHPVMQQVSEIFDNS